MFSSPKRHPYHDFPESLAEEYLAELQAWHISKSWSGRQVYYQDYQRTTVLHDAIEWDCSDDIIFAFCKAWGDPTDKKQILDRDIASPLTHLILYKRSFELISKVVALGGNPKKSKTWYAYHKHPSIFDSKYLLTHKDLDIFHPDVKIVDAMLSRACSGKARTNEIYHESVHTSHAAVLHPDVRLVEAMLSAGCSFHGEELYTALTYGEPEVFKLLLSRANKHLDWMKTIKIILDEYEVTIDKKIPKISTYPTDMIKLKENLANLVIKQPPSSFHISYLIEKASELKSSKKVLQYFFSAGFPKNID